MRSASSNAPFGNEARTTSRGTTLRITAEALPSLLTMVRMALPSRLAVMTTAAGFEQMPPRHVNMRELMNSLTQPVEQTG